MRKAVYLAIAIAVIAACQEREPIVQGSESDEIHASIEDIAFVRTTMNEDNCIRWSEGDQAVGFMKSPSGQKYQIRDSDTGKTEGTFSRTDPGSSDSPEENPVWSHNVVYYPYSDSIEADKSESGYRLDVSLPSEQAYMQGGFGNGSMPMAAVSEDRQFIFRNICGGMKLRLKGTQTITSITLKGNNGEKLAGTASVIISPENKPTITMASDASDAVTLNCSYGVQLNEDSPTEFIIVIPPVVFSKGFVINATDTEGQTYTIETDKPQNIMRSYILTIPEKTLGETADDRWVDLGLPSGILWAAYNIGATSPEEYGGYYAWGETEEKSEYFFENFKFYNPTTNDHDFIGTSICGKEYDVAYMKWGVDARMPTLDEAIELINNCTITGHTLNGVKGCLVTGPNGNSIFLPFAGYKDTTDLILHESDAVFWSGTAMKEYHGTAFRFVFNEEGGRWDDFFGRHMGFSIRAVTKQ